MREPVDLESVAAPAFGLSDDVPALRTGWHSHEQHQLVYSASGAMELEALGMQWRLPPQRAAWIKAGVPHSARASGPVFLRTLYFSSEIFGGIDEDCRIFSVTPLAKEMLLYAMRWGPTCDPRDDTAQQFFRALIALCKEWIRDARPAGLPAARTPELDRAMRYALLNLGGKPSFADAATAAGLSTRSLARRFAREAQTTWRRFLRDARVLKAAELLAMRDARVTDTAYEVGFESVAAFTRAFAGLMGERPGAYRRRVAG